MDDPTLEAARRGDRQAQAALLGELQDRWYRLSFGLLGNADAARDATQESAVRFLRQLAGFRGESQLTTWALGIAINVAREMKRASSRPIDGLRLVGGANEPVAPDEQAATAEEAGALREIIGHLPDSQREAVMLRFFEELSTEETASAMQCAVGTVKATIHQALRSLKQQMRQAR